MNYFAKMKSPNNKTEKLFTPLEIGDLKLPHRIIMAPMTRSRADGEGKVPTKLNALYYAQRASAALIISEGTQISPEAVGYPATPGIYTDEQVAGWKLVTDAVHLAGGKIFAQLWHVGRLSLAEYQPNGQVPIAPSAIRANSELFSPAGLKPAPVPRALTLAEVEQIIRDFAQAAQCAKNAGFDGIEIHGANGYLIDQFLRDGSNKRTDRYGGSLEKRIRFLIELLDAVSIVWGTKRVGVRLSPQNFTYSDAFDSNPLKTFSAVVQVLNARDLAYLHLLEFPKSFPIGIQPNQPAYTSTLR